MKKIHWLSLFFVYLAPLSNTVDASLIKSLNASIWSEYKANHFEGLSDEEKTAKLKEIFEDQCLFAKNHSIRRFIVKILNPSDFSFFHPNHFNSNKPDNIFYWLKELIKITEVEVLFDEKPFSLEKVSYVDSFYTIYQSLCYQIKISYPPFGDFYNLPEKLDWLSLITQTHTQEPNDKPFIHGIVIAPPKINPPEVYQNLINALDRYKHSHHSSLIYNPFPFLKTGMLLYLDQKELILANLARFPLCLDLAGNLPNTPGIELPLGFPSDGILPPPWRNQENKEPLLNTVYLQLADKRLIPTIYQNYEVFSNPINANFLAATQLADDFMKIFQGRPFKKGPGKISTTQGCFYIKGNGTFFRKGDPDTGQGQFRKGQFITLHPPDVEESIHRKISEDPHVNDLLKLCAPFSLTEDIEEADYYYAPIPTCWMTPKTSSFLQSRIYFVFSTEFTVNKDMYLGNWSLTNFLYFLSGSHQHRGFLDKLIFTHLNGELSHPFKNIVLYDYSTIPNGSLYPQNNWNLKNASLHDAFINNNGFIEY